MHKAVLETATFADAIAKAAWVAPTKGEALDRAGGIVLELNVSSNPTPFVVKATDLEVTYRQEVSFLSVTPDPIVWRLPNLLAGVMKTMPMGAGSTTTIIDKGDGWVYFKVGAKDAAKLRPIQGGYPEIPRFDPAECKAVTGFAQRLAQVSWATVARFGGVLSGVHMDGERLLATDKAKLAIVDCVVPVDRPVTAPLAEVSGLLKNTGEVRLFASVDRLHIMTDTDTQATCLLFGEKYPDVLGLTKRAPQPAYRIKVSKQEVEEALTRMLALIEGDRYPVTTLEISTSALKLRMQAPEVGEVYSEVPISGGPTDPLTVRFTPGELVNAFQATKQSMVEFGLGPTPLSALWVSDDQGYLSVLMPRKPT